MNIHDRFLLGLSYTDFLTRHGTDVHRGRWEKVHGQVALTAPQRQLLGSFTRRMPVLCLAGAWCGDCVNQCPIFDHFAQAAPAIELRFVDRDEHRDLQTVLRINAGDRVPVVVFFSEDGELIGWYGERTLSKYRQMMIEMAGASCPTGIVAANDPLLAQVTQDWLDEFERVQWLLRLSPRLRQRHGD
jgi:thiol-disulfide isomerase/thioredoxin